MLVPAQPLLGSPYLLPYSAYRKHGKVAGVSPTDWAELSQLTNKKLVFSPLGADSKEDSLSLPPDTSITHLVLIPQRRPSRRGHGGERWIHWVEEIHYLA